MTEVSLKFRVVRPWYFGPLKAITMAALRVRVALTGRQPTPWEIDRITRWFTSRIRITAA